MSIWVGLSATDTPTLVPLTGSRPPTPKPVDCSPPRTWLSVMVEGEVPSRLVVEVVLLLVVVMVLVTTGALPKKAEPEAGGGAPAASLRLSTHWVHRMQEAATSCR